MKRRATPAIGDQFLFIALDEETKLIPSFTLGKRTRENAEAFMRTTSQAGSWSRRCSIRRRPRLSTDGWNAYPNAIDGAFGGSAWTTAS